MAAAALLVVTGPASSAADDPDLEQEIDSDQEVSTETAVLDDGHVDMGPRYVDDEWTFLIHDDTAEPPVWRWMEDTVFQVSDAARLAVPDNDAYAFLPAEPGTEVHVVPQAQQPGVVWLGWNTQDPAVMETVDRGVTLRLRRVEGPGEMVMFLQSGDLGDPEPLWDSREEYPQDVWVENNTHTHANWVFSEPGVYLVEVEATADLVTGETESAVEVMRLAVGNETSTDEALNAEYVLTQDAALDDPGAESGDGEASGDAEDTGGGVATGLLIAVAGGVALLIALAVVVFRGRRAKARAAELSAAEASSERAR
ncbi:choice-of-anchor M domain-containing protein [Phytoactinopolyspora mesophila]|uniref:Surface-anchored protein n=1 Tax=Phytoactinopolyspora mesophila TaxID=2650750 RepID=A0A7K3MAZ1_9ACTN|nr:hypothetical protein [Phytoactinopolyspora mesophila]